MNTLPESVYDVVAQTVYSLVPIAPVIIVILLLLYGSIPGVHKSLASGYRDDKTSYCGAQNFFGPSVRNLLYRTLLVPRTLKLVVYFWKIRTPLDSRRVPYG
jgi:hypothetical protein